MPNKTMEDYLKGSGGLNLAQLAIAQGNVDIFEIAQRDKQVGEVLGYLIGDSFDDYKALEMFEDILISNDAIVAILSSSITFDAVLVSKYALDKMYTSQTFLNEIIANSELTAKLIASDTAMSSLVSSDKALKVLCSSATAKDSFADVLQSHRVSITSTLEASSLFAKTTTTFAQQASIIKTELADTNTIIIPRTSNPVNADSTMNVARYIYYSEDTSKQIWSYTGYASSTTSISTGVSLRGITHKQNYNSVSYYSKPTCDIYTVI